MFLLVLICGLLMTVPGLAVELTWPSTPIPPATWRAAPLDSAEEDAPVMKLLQTKGEVGLPALTQGRTWTTLPVTAGDVRFAAAAGDGQRVLLAHFFNPLVYQPEPFIFRVTSNMPVTFAVNGETLQGTADPATHAMQYNRHGAQIRVGMNRVMIIAPAAGELLVHVTISNPGDLRFFAELPNQLDPKQHVGDWESATISNGLVNASVAIPDVTKGYYRGNRFEQAGFITNLTYAGHTFFLGAKEPYAPLNSSISVGPAEEFFDGIAFDDAKPGDPFIKIGVGLYEKTATPQERHTWYQPYWQLRPFAWKTQRSANAMTFTQEVDGPRGWGYRYVKRLVLEPGAPILRIEHTFTNTGTHFIEAEQYAHNWVQLDKQPVPQGGYRITFPFTPKAIKESPKVKLTGNALDIQGESGLTTLGGWTASTRDTCGVITSTGTSAAIRISSDFPLSGLTVFFADNCVCMEQFFRFVLKPGESISWTRTYEFFDKYQPAK
ncbi:MAG TPA: hypothetical protein VGM23_16205 [Armatimonadota bacterium]|jgi:hypothetical protein